MNNNYTQTLIIAFGLITSACRMLGQNTFPSTGEVGIGTTTPTYPLSIIYNSSGSYTMADFELTADATNSDSGAGRFDANDSVGSNRLRGIKVDLVRGSSAQSESTIGIDVQIHQQMETNGGDGIQIESEENGWLSSGTGVDNDVGLLIRGEDGWTRAISYKDTSYNDLFYVDSTGTMYSTAIYTYSSSKFKTGIAPLSVQKALDYIQHLSPVAFRYKTQPSIQHLGFIAEDSPCPLSSANKQGMNLPDIVAVLAGVIKTERAELKALESDPHKSNL